MRVLSKIPAFLFSMAYLAGFLMLAALLSIVPDALALHAGSAGRPAAMLLAIVILTTLLHVLLLDVRSMFAGSPKTA